MIGRNSVRRFRISWPRNITPTGLPPLDIVWVNTSGAVDWRGRDGGVLTQLPHNSPLPICIPQGTPLSAIPRFSATLALRTPHKFSTVSLLQARNLDAASLEKLRLGPQWVNYARIPVLLHNTQHKITNFHSNGNLTIK